jgi:hypothetical protein
VYAIINIMTMEAILYVNLAIIHVKHVWAQQLVQLAIHYNLDKQTRVEYTVAVWLNFMKTQIA